MSVIERIYERVLGWAGTLVWWGFETWIRLTGRVVTAREASWLEGYWSDCDQVGSDILPQISQRHDMLLEQSDAAGLLHSFEDLAGPSFEPRQVPKVVHDFYERTARHSFDVSASWSTPLAWLAALLIRTACRVIDQCNLPLDQEEAEAGVTNEVIHLRERRSGRRRQTCWLRRSKRTGRTMYAGFYGVCRPPGSDGPCVKTVFPLPNGYLCVLLKPTVHPAGGLELVSKGESFGDAGFYWVQRGEDGTRRVKYIPLHESIHVFVDANGELRTDHKFYLWGVQFLWLRYDIVADSKRRGMTDDTCHMRLTRKSLRGDVDQQPRASEQDLAPLHHAGPTRKFKKVRNDLAHFAENHSEDTWIPSLWRKRDDVQNSSTRR